MLIRRWFIERLLIIVELHHRRINSGMCSVNQNGGERSGLACFDVPSFQRRRRPVDMSRTWLVRVFRNITELPIFRISQTQILELTLCSYSLT